MMRPSSLPVLSKPGSLCLCPMKYDEDQAHNECDIIQSGSMREMGYPVMMVARKSELQVVEKRGLREICVLHLEVGLTFALQSLLFIIEDDTGVHGLEEVLDMNMLTIGRRSSMSRSC
ncbi:hypothetical protein HBI49_204520 [Parastagonospora nodorum]|nr:hypothetical protein HBH48_244390 [Parastagonospora nodorum]KAH4113247.1 hypothetical protein HBH47_213960 [Parastagonospora nodorum]KAH4432435.1 hypothetical protein HBH91_222960 [Parastagonospora nodorum]KAH4842737.1 hypothetical protein HBH59_215830 [Parastagonospora nodorum]KAH4860268.1 hypothetical protein HBH58_200290 [Parastagonospora nodorum]